MYDIDISNTLSPDQQIKLKKSIQTANGYVEKGKKQVCISQNIIKDGWDNSACKNIEKENENGKTDLICECKSLTPTTVISDVKNLFTQQSTLGDAFGSEGVNALINFEFWKSVIFYVFIFKTILLVYFVYNGYRKDKINFLQEQQKTKLKEQKLQDEENIDDQIKKQVKQDLKEKQQLEQNNLFQNDNQGKLSQQSERAEINQVLPFNDNINKDYQQSDLDNKSVNDDNNINKIYQTEKDNLSEIKNDIQKEDKQDNKNTNINDVREYTDYEVDKEQLNQQDIYSSKNGKKKSRIFRYKQKKRLQLKQQQTIVENNELNSQNSIPNNQVQNDNISQISSNVKLKNENQIKQENKEKQEQKQKIVYVKQNEVVNYVLRIHELIGIYYVYDPELSRPVRYLCFYLKLCIVLGFSSSMINDQSTQYQSILISSVTSILSSIFVEILKALLSKKQIIKIIGYIIYFGISGTSIYLMITNAAIMGVNTSNNWTVAYLFSFLIDVFFFQIILGYLKLVIFNWSLDKQGCPKIIQNTLSKDENMSKYFQSDFKA